MWGEHPGTQVARLSRGRWCAVLLEDLESLDPVQPEQPDILGPVTPALEIPVSVEVDQPHGINIALGRLIAPRHQIAEVNAPASSQGLPGQNNVLVAGLLIDEHLDA